MGMAIGWTYRRMLYEPKMKPMVRPTPPPMRKPILEKTWSGEHYESPTAKQWTMRAAYFTVGRRGCQMEFYLCRRGFGTYFCRTWTAPVHELEEREAWLL